MASSPAMEGKTTFIKCDLQNLSSVKECANAFLQRENRLDILICNAGIMAVVPSLTKDGYETQFGTNHVGHAALIQELLPTLEHTVEEHGDARLVSVTSRGLYMATGGIAFDKLQELTSNKFLTRWGNYAQSKLANALYIRALAQRYPRITCVAVHPGVIVTDLVGTLGFWDRLLVDVTTIGRKISPEQGALNSLWAATSSKEEIESGTYYEPVGVPGKLTKSLQDDKLVAELWEWTQTQLSKHGSTTEQSSVPLA